MQYKKRYKLYLKDVHDKLGNGNASFCQSELLLLFFPVPKAFPWSTLTSMMKQQLIREVKGIVSVVRTLNFLAF